MQRLESITRSELLKGTRVLITGCGYKPVQHTFYDITTNEPSHDSIQIDGQEMKANIGTATAGVLACHGATVHFVSRTETKLERIYQVLAESVPMEKMEYSAVDLVDKEQVAAFVCSLPKDKPIYWVQSIGLGAGAYTITDDNPYLHIDEIPLELLEQESLTVLRGTHILMQELLPIFREQNKRFCGETRIAIISSMSAIRGFRQGGTHCAAKGAISRYTNSAMLDLFRERIYVTDIRPGIIDTGMYDGRRVQKVVRNISEDYGGIHTQHFCAAPPTSVGQAVAFVFITPAHIPSLNLVAKGQFPNEGS